MATSRLADLNRIYPVIPRVLCGQDFISRPTEALSNAEGGAEGVSAQIIRCASAANIPQQRRGSTPPRPAPSRPKIPGCREALPQKSGAVCAQSAASAAAPKSRSRFAEFASWFPFNAPQSRTGMPPLQRNSRVGRDTPFGVAQGRLCPPPLTLVFDVDLRVP